MKGDIIMSTKTINRASIMEKLVRREMKQAEAAELLNLSIRQVKRLVKIHKLEGISGLVHKAKGKSSNNQVDQDNLDKAIQTIRDKYWDFAPTLAHEKLVEEHKFKLSLSRLRKEMVLVGLWKAKARKKPTVHPLRERRSAFGELVQLDGSPHDWFEGRAPKCNLNVAIDDATGRPFLEFSPSETTQDYFSLLDKYIHKFGLPMAIYADKHSIFRVNKPAKLNHKKPSRSDHHAGLTQFGRAMKELGIELIAANSPQAKGRVENINKTLQDRLVKELRLKQISSIQEANLFLLEYAKKYSLKFSIQPRSKVDMHRSLPRGVDLSKILCLKECRVLSKNLSCQYHSNILQIKTKKSSYRFRGMVATIREQHDGLITVWDNHDKSLDFSVIQKTQQKPEVSSKEINKLVDDILTQNGHSTKLGKNPWDSNPRDYEEQSMFYKPRGTV